MTATVLLAQSSGRQEAAWRAALASQGFGVAAVARGESLFGLATTPAGRARRCDLLVADLDELVAERLRADDLCRAFAAARPGAGIVLTLGRRLEVAAGERRWARAQGALDLLPALSMARTAAADGFAAICARLGRAAVDPQALGHALRELANEAVSVEGDVVAQLAQHGIDPVEIAARMRGDAGVARAERRYRLKWYPNCFVGSEAVDWLVQGYGLAREDAVSLGQHLLERGVIHHVVKEQPFLDGFFFYRFSGAEDAIDRLEVDDVVARLRGEGGVPIGERQYLGRRYAACFTGRAAVDFVAAAFGVGREEATGLGQRLLDLGLLHHVLDEHDFVDGEFFYRFYADETG